eukprot:tig00001027_g6394.t1
MQERFAPGDRPPGHERNIVLDVPRLPTRGRSPPLARVNHTRSTQQRSGKLFSHHPRSTQQRSGKLFSHHPRSTQQRSRTPR